MISLHAQRGTRTLTSLRTPDLPAGRQVLSLVCLPVSPPGHIKILGLVYLSTCPDLRGFTTWIYFLTKNDIKIDNKIPLKFNTFTVEIVTTKLHCQCSAKVELSVSWMLWFIHNIHYYDIFTNLFWQTNGQDSYCTTIIRQEGYNQTSYGTSIVF